MSVELLGATDGRIDYGDIAALAGQTELSVALTILPDNNPGVGKRLVGQWGNTAATEQCFLISMPDVGGARRPGLVVYAGGNYFGRFCDNNVLTAGALSRLLFTWKAGAPDEIHLWVDGVDQPISEWVGSDNVAGLLNSVRNVQVGHETDTSSDGADGDYAEFALWGEVVPDWFAEAYTTHGLSPRFWQSNGILYAPLVNASSLLDEWGGVVGSATAASDALHPSVFYPGVSPVWQPPPPPYAPALTHGNHPSEDIPRQDFGAGVPGHTAPQGTFYWDTTAKHQYVNTDGAATWRNLTDHSELSGIGGGEDDHIEYLLADGTRNLSGDLLVDTDKEIQFRSNTEAIFSSAADQLDLRAVTAVQIDAPATVFTGQLQATVQGIAGGLLIGGDAQLYRSDADELMLAAGDVLAINDANFTLYAAGDPTIVVDTNDFFVYDRAGNYYSFNIASTEHLRLSATELIATTVDMYFVGDGSGLPYGNMYGEMISETVATGAAGAGVWVELTAGLTGGEVNLMTFANNHELTVTKAGRYLITWSMSVHTSTANDEIEGTIAINNTANGAAGCHGTLVKANTSIAIAGTIILDLAANDDISMALENHAAARDVVVEHVACTVVMVGGT